MALQKPSLESRISGQLSVNELGTSDTRIGKDDPFIFGQRYLTNSEEVFNHNAWDHVEWGPEQINEAESKISEHSSSPVPENEKKIYNATPAKFWDKFYKNHKEGFFKDRKWLQIEFPLLYEVSSSSYNDKPVKILEVGCGAGNTLFPILRQNENKNLKMIGVDYAPSSIKLIKENPDFVECSKNVEAYVWDLANEEGILPSENMEPNSVDIVVMIFIFSALAPNQWDQAIKNLDKILKPGGKILFRDYGRYDLAQVRLKKERYLDDNFYIRGDGTRVYFFTEEELRSIFIEKGKFLEDRIGTDRRLLVNRKKQLKMYRIWLQGVFTKPLDNVEKPTGISSDLMAKLGLDDDSEDEDGSTPPITCGCESCHSGHPH